jgi:hypothetical protein
MENLMPSTIANAIPALEELNTILDKAYWEANSLNVKDSIYDCISSVNKELSELSKLSIQDHGMVYEPISGEFKIATQRLSTLRKYLDSHIMRNSTLTRLESVVSTVQELITPNHDLDDK